MISFVFTAQFLKDANKLRKSKNDYVKLFDLIRNISENLFTGIGHPEPLKYQKATWSRKINKKDRLVYTVKENTVFLISCIGHYDDK